jgi:membrane protease YdiL (CAAX protease family)
MKKATVFLTITFLLSWPVAFLSFGSGANLYTASGLALAFYFMFTPLISTIITQKVIYRQNVKKPFCVSFRPNWWFLVALLLPGILALASIVVSLLFPGVSLTANPTETNVFAFFSQNLTQEQLTEFTRSASETPVHPFLMAMLGGTFAGLTINGVAGLGEELGWRGLLLREFAGFGFWRASIVIGVIWGLWHLPFIIHGHNYPGHPVAGVFMMILWTVLFSPLIGYVTVRAESVIAAAIMHGALNGTAIAPLVVLKGGHVLQIGVVGFAGIFVLVGLNLVLVAVGRPREWYDKWMERTPDSAAQP